ncbi:MAG: 30S ribosomal protein S9 [Bacteroidales bacterium]
MEAIHTIGRRKAAVARIYMSDGAGEITVNGKDYKEYFPLDTLQYIVCQPLEEVEVSGKYKIKVNLKGGGVNGQAEALRLAIARALLHVDAEYRPALKAAGFLTRDSREVERKKPGQPKARKRFQFSKR